VIAKFKVPAAGEQRERGRGSAELGAVFSSRKRTGIYYIINMCKIMKNLGVGCKENEFPKVQYLLKTISELVERMHSTRKKMRKLFSWPCLTLATRAASNCFPHTCPVKNFAL
jgi:hypothetical protein